MQNSRAMIWYDGMKQANSLTFFRLFYFCLFSVHISVAYCIFMHWVWWKLFSIHADFLSSSAKMFTVKMSYFSARRFNRMYQHVLKTPVLPFPVYHLTWPLFTIFMAYRGRWNAIKWFLSTLDIISSATDTDRGKYYHFYLWWNMLWIKVILK